jgi:hypothetical protein
MDDLFDAAPMYDEDYLYFFVAPSGLSEVATRGPNLRAEHLCRDVEAWMSDPLSLVTWYRKSPQLEISRGMVTFDRVAACNSNFAVTLSSSQYLPDRMSIE